MERAAAVWLLCLLLLEPLGSQARVLQTSFRAGAPPVVQPVPDEKLLAEREEGATEPGRPRGRADLSTHTGGLEIGEVPQPHVGVRPLACSRAVARCLLQCSGHTGGAEDITYFWKMGDGEWEELEKTIEILNIYELQHVRTFSCRMRNPVSEKDSEPIRNPFHREEETPDSGVELIVGGAFGAAVLVSVALFAFYLSGRASRSLKAAFRSHGPQ